MTQAYTRQSIIDYGKANNYSSSDINKAINSAKYSLVDYGINNGYTGSEINEALNKAGYDKYNPLRAKANWENLLPNISKGAKEFYRDMRTIGGIVAQPFMDVRDAKPGTKKEVAKQKFMEAINNDRIQRMGAGAVAGAIAGSKLNKLIGTAGGAITGGLVGLLGPREMADAWLNTYDTSTSDFGRKSASDIVANATQGAFRNPLMAGLDVLSLGGAKAIGKAGRAVGRSIPKNSPLWLQSLIQSPDVRNFNRDITQAIENAKAGNIDIIKPLNELGSTFKLDNEALARYIMLGDKGNLNKSQLELADKVLKSVRGGEEKAISYGLLDKQLSRRNVISQYVMQNVMDKIPNVLHRDVMSYIETGNLTPRMAQATLANPSLKQFIDTAISKGSKLYDENKIGFISQALTPTIDPIGEIRARDIAKTRSGGYFGTSREIGRATIEDISKKIEDSLAFQQSEIAKATEALDILDTVLGKQGVSSVITDINNIPKGKTVVNVDVFKKKIKEAIQGGKDVDPLQALNASRVPEKGALLIDDVYFEALKNAMAPRVSSSLKDASNAFKKTVLASPHWFMQNRIGNMTNNAMGGVTPLDYIDARRHWNSIPERLKSQTSFTGYVGDSNLSLPSAFINPIKKISKEINRYKEGKKGLGDTGRLATQTLSEISNIFSNPIFKLEAGAETLDRYANMIHQAKVEAKATGKDWRYIIDKANKDNRLFNKLNNEVNKDLGDYIGRNYLIPNQMYEQLGLLVPFYRFLTQTGRTTLHQLANHGTPFQFTVMNPAKAGKKYSEQVMSLYGLTPEEYEGGMPYALNDDGSYRYVGLEPLPFGAVVSDLLSDSNKLSLLAPQYTLAGDIMSYKKGGEWLPSSPGLTEYKLAYGTSKGYEPTNAERIGYGATQLANTFWAPTRATSGYLREALNAMIGKPTLSLYDTSIIPMENPLSYKKELLPETIGKWFGIQTRPYYAKQVKKNKKPSKYEIRNKARYNKRVQENTKGKK